MAYLFNFNYGGMSENDRLPQHKNLRIFLAKKQFQIKKMVLYRTKFLEVNVIVKILFDHQIKYYIYILKNLEYRNK